MFILINGFAHFTSKTIQSVGTPVIVTMAIYLQCSKSQWPGQWQPFYFLEFCWSAIHERLRDTGVSRGVKSHKLHRLKLF